MAMYDESHHHLHKKVLKNSPARRKTKLLVVICSFVFLALIIGYELLTDTFQWSHAFIYGIGWFIAFLAVVTKFVMKTIVWIADLVGLNNEPTVVISIGLIVGPLMAVYLLLESQKAMIPTTLQFSIVTVTATLGGLVIAGANYSKINYFRRYELLEVAQKLIVATVTFIFFAVFYVLASVGENVDPNKWPSSGIEIIKWVFLWISMLLFLSGAGLSVIGIIDLALALKHLKHDD
jgi:hypothetical protein